MMLRDEQDQLSVASKPSLQAKGTLISDPRPLSACQVSLPWANSPSKSKD